jgi:aminopeptidase N
VSTPRRRGTRLVAALSSAAVMLAAAGCTPSPPVTPSPAGPETPAFTLDELAAGRSEPVRDPVYPDYGNPALDVLGYDLKVRWQPERRELVGDATIHLRAVTATTQLSLDFSSAYTVDSATVNGTAATPTWDGDDLVTPATLPAGEVATLRVHYHGRPATVPMRSGRGDFDEGLGLRSNVDNEAWTMQEPYGASTWYPANELPSDEALYDVSVTVPTGWVGVANGGLSGIMHGSGEDTYRWSSDDPVAAYVATLAVGRYTQLTDTGPHGLPLTYWLRTGKDEAFEPAVRRTPELLGWLELKFGPYPFATAGVVLVDSESAMETQQMVTYGAELRDGSADLDAAAEVLLHEYAHQWFGDAVTPTDWTGMWLNEGFATYAEILWTVEQRMIPEASWVSFARANDARSRPVAGPPGNPRADHFGEANVYDGPAMMLREIHRAVGDDAFFAFARDWVQTQRNHQVDRAGFIRFVNQHTGRDFTALINEWLDSPTTPAGS